MFLVPSPVRHAVRRWRARPGLALVATGILALGIGATTAMYSIVNAALLKDEPWPGADRLVRIYAVQPHQRANPAFVSRWDRMPIAWQAWRDLQQAPAFAEVAAWVPAQQIAGTDRTELVDAWFASSNLPGLVGAVPLHGRFFTREEDETDSGVVVLSHGVWTRLFGADPEVIGASTFVTPPGDQATSTRRRTIVGILPAGFSLPGGTPDVLIPIGVHRYNGSFGNPFLHAMGRLADSTTVGAATSAAEPLVRRDESPDRRGARVVTVRADRLGVGDRSLWLLLAGAALLLVVACSNVAGLLLGDARARQHETAVRLALGGTRAAILGALLAEHAMLALASGTAGLLLASWLLPALTALAPPGLFGPQAVEIDRAIALWSLAAAVVTTLAAAWLPAMAMSSARPGDALKAGSKEVTRGGRWRHRLVVASQFGLATVLLVGAGLFTETLLRLGREPLGFTPDRVGVLELVQARSVPRPVTPEERETMIELRRTDTGALSRMLLAREWAPIGDLMPRLRALPDVEAVAIAGTIPFGDRTAGAVAVRGEGQRADEAQPVSMRPVTPEFFDVMGIRVLRGRVFEAGEEWSPVRPVILSESAERRLFGENAVGRGLYRETVRSTVIGVVPDVRDGVRGRDGQATVYLPLLAARSAAYLLVRSRGEPAALLPGLRDVVTREAPLIVTATSAMAERVASALVIERGRAMLSAMYGGVALLLAAVGLYGLAARLVVERRREIGIRVALGAAPRDVRRVVMTDAWLIVALGLLVGLPGALAASQLARGLLYGVAPAAPHILAMALGALAVAAVLATAVPAWRATRVDPAVTLRDE